MSNLKRIIPGKYYHHNSIIHRLDPRTKVLALIFLIISISITGNILELLLIALLIFISILFSKLPIISIAKDLKPFLWILVSLFLLHLLFEENKAGAFLALGPIKMTWNGLQKGILVGFRFLLIVLSAFILTYTTIPICLADAISRLTKPFKIIGINTEQLPLITMFVMYFVPELYNELNRLIIIQNMKGRKTWRRKFIREPNLLINLLIILVRNSIQKSDQLLIGIESRCYNGHLRSNLYNYYFKLSDSLVLFISISIFISFIIKYFFI
ncbi:hypothetical protein GF312_03015 [Candidatus Poribacteria bacterium]|nr:hypothetical protein [Candidatus Poribacteria bacterium]